MQMSNSLGARARQSGTGQDLGICIDLLIDTAKGGVEYALLDIGSTFQVTQALVSRRRLRWSDNDLVVALTQEEVEDRCVDIEADTQSAEAVNLAAMPPVVVGPFGYTVAPVMAGAMANVLADQSARPKIDERHAHWYWYQSLDGLPLFDSSGPLGRLSDIILDPETLHCQQLVAEDENGEHTRYPFATLRSVTRQGESLILDTTQPPGYVPEDSAE